MSEPLKITVGSQPLLLGLSFDGGQAKFQPANEWDENRGEYVPYGTVPQAAPTRLEDLIDDELGASIFLSRLDAKLKGCPLTNFQREMIAEALGATREMAKSRLANRVMLGVTTDNCVDMIQR